MALVEGDRAVKAAGISILLAAALAAPAAANDQNQVARKALATLAERGDRADQPRSVRAYFYGSSKNVSKVAGALYKDGWTDVQEYPDPQKGPPFVVATRTMTSEPTRVMEVANRLQAMASTHGVTLEALEVPPVR